MEWEKVIRYFLQFQNTTAQCYVMEDITDTISLCTELIGFVTSILYEKVA